MHLPRKQPVDGPILGYLEIFIPKDREKIEAALQDLLGTPDGVMLLNLLENAVVHQTFEVSADPRAFEARNAQAILVADLKRIASQDDREYATGRRTERPARNLRRHAPD